MTAPRATTKKRVPRIRENLPAPSSPEGELFHYTPYEAAPWTPFSGRKLSALIAAREIEYTFNGRDNYLTGRQIAALNERYTVKPFSKPAHATAA
ncbi:hypothetical protein [Streptomyces sp. NPDC046859]|uniref:hypothetical protein n=1 Tax=Streptomyces sp. NPDC046859 TaxID=3155734 RepID=UPI0033CB9E76